MYNPKHFQVDDLTELHAMLEQFSFATLVTQQGFHRATWGFLDTYCDEAYIGIPADWPAADRHFYRARFVIDQARQKVAA